MMLFMAPFFIFKVHAGVGPAFQNCTATQWRPTNLGWDKCDSKRNLDWTNDGLAFCTHSWKCPKNEICDEENYGCKREDINLAAWMGDGRIWKKIENKTLENLTLVGTHDSATYRREITPSIFVANNVINENCWEFLQKSSWINYLPRQYFHKMCQTQRLSVNGQLKNGARVLDIRVTWYEDKKVWYTEHGILFVPLKEVLTDIYNFMTQHKSEKEILVINLQNLTISGENQTNESKHPPLEALANLEKLFKDLKDEVGFLMVKKSAKGGELNLPTLQEMIKEKKRILLYITAGKNIETKNILPSISNLGEDIVSQKYSWPNKAPYEDVISYNVSEMIANIPNVTVANQNKPKVYHKTELTLMGFQITPRPADYLCGFFNYGCKEEWSYYHKSLLGYAKSLNGQFVNFILEHVVPLAPHLRPNLIRVDDISSAPFDQVIALLYLNNYGLYETNYVSRKK